MRDEVLSSIGAEYVDKSGYQVSDLDDVEFYWKNDRLPSVFRPGMDTTSSLLTFNDFDMGSMAEIPIPSDGEQDKENTPPLPNTPVS